MAGFEDLVPVELGHVQVEEDEVDRLAGHELEGDPAVLRLHHGVAEPAETPGEDLPVGLVVIHDEDETPVRTVAGGRFGGCSLGRLRCRPPPDQLGGPLCGGGDLGHEALSVGITTGVDASGEPQHIIERALECAAEFVGVESAVGVGAEDALHGTHHLLAGRDDVGQVRVASLLEEQFGVADDVVDLIQEFVAQPAGGVRVGHEPPPRRASILSTSRGRSTGFVSKSSQPAASAFSRSPAMA